MNEPLAIMRDMSDRTLEALELARRNNAANMGKQLRELVELIIQERVEAELARIVREGRHKADEKEISLAELCLPIDGAE